MRLIDQIVENYRRESLTLFQKLRKLSAAVTKMTADAHEELLAHFVISDKRASEIQVVSNLSELTELEREVRRRVFLLTAVDLLVKQHIEPLLQFDEHEELEMGDSALTIPDPVWAFSLGIMLTRVAAMPDAPRTATAKKKRSQKLSAKNLVEFILGPPTTSRQPNEERIVDRKWPFEKMVRPYFQTEMSLEELWTLTRKIFVDAGLLDKNLPPDSPILRNCYRSLSRKQARWGGPRTNGNGRTHPA